MADGFQAFECALTQPQHVRHADAPLILARHIDKVTECSGDGTTFGVVLRGPCRLRATTADYTLAEGMYFSLPEQGRLEGGAAWCVTHVGYRGMFQIGGPIEDTGRLRYINGCSDTVLVAPPILGDPCLNLLCIPPGVAQATHTHPSLRCGVVMNGTGVCRAANGDFPLKAGLAWLIPADCVHSFHTTEDSLRIVAYHPDSDCGPSDSDHPMLNRTVIDGVTANRILQPRQHHS